MHRFCKSINVSKDGASTATEHDFTLAKDSLVRKSLHFVSFRWSLTPPADHFCLRLRKIFAELKTQPAVYLDSQVRREQNEAQSHSLFVVYILKQLETVSESMKNHQTDSNVKNIQ